MKWYEVKEQAAGKKRLHLTFFFYKLFGKNAVKVIAFFVTFFAFLFAKDLRKCSVKYLSSVGEKTSLLNVFKHFLSFSYCLADKIEIFTDKYDYKKLSIQKNDDKEKFFNDVKNKNGIFFICSHLGNTDIIRTFFKNCSEVSGVKVNVFIETKHCEIFSDFIKEVTVDNPFFTYPVEDISVDTSIEIKEKLDNGEIVFLAGDRIAPNNSNAVFEADFLNKKVDFPIGAFKFALMMNNPIYFIICAKEPKDRYNIHLKKFEFTGSRKERYDALKQQYISFLEQKTREYPLQFYHFYDFFKN